MGEQPGFLLGFIVSNCIIMLPIADSTPTDGTYTNTVTNLLDGDDISRSHLDVCCQMNVGYLNWERNASGHTVSKSGISFEMLDWLSFFMKFEYGCLPHRDSDESFTRDNETNMTVVTQLYKLKHGMCHISPIPYVISYTRFKNYCDFLSPFIYSSFLLLIPMPKFSIGGSLTSVWKPFEISVWLALSVSIAVTILLSIINWLYSQSKVAKSERNKVSLELHSLFIYGLLVSKAGFRAPSTFKMRLAGGAWCIAALILTNYYSSVLTSLITASTPVPIANSVEEMANNEDIELFIVKGRAIAVMIAEGKNNNPSLKKLDKKLKSFKNSLCSNDDDCFRRVIERKTTTFLHDKPSLFAMVSEDYRQTGRCNVAFAKEPFHMVQIAWAISKNYSKFETFQRGMLRMMEAGLVEHWTELYLPVPIQCILDPNCRQAKMADIRHPALVNLHGLVPAFLFLLFGFILAFIALLAEWINKLKLWQFLILCRSLPTNQ